MTDPDPKTRPHGDGRIVNLLFTDGHASAWNLPASMIPVWDWFDAGSYAKAGFGNGWVQQLPWWWVEADRSGR